MTTEITEEMVKEILEYHWPGYVGNTEKRDDEYSVSLVPVASEKNSEGQTQDELPTGCSSVSWREAIADLAANYAPYIPLDEIDGRFQFLFDE